MLEVGRQRFRQRRRCSTRSRSAPACPACASASSRATRRFIKPFLDLRSVAAPQVPVPAQEVAIAAYNDETHVRGEPRALPRQVRSRRPDHRQPLRLQAPGRRLLPLARRVGAGRQRGRDAEALEGGGPARAARQLRGARAGRRLQSGRRLHPHRDGAGPRDHRRSAASSRRRAWEWIMPAIRYTLSAADLVGRIARRAAPPPARDHRARRCSASPASRRSRSPPGRCRTPRCSHATNAPVRNMLGLPGAISADLMMQLLGIATIAFLFPVAAWGWRLLTHRPLDRERARARPVDRRRRRGRGLCLLPAAEQGVAAADRTRRRDRRRAAARTRLGVRRAALRRDALRHRDRDRGCGIHDARARGRLRLAPVESEDDDEAENRRRRRRRPRRNGRRTTRRTKRPSRAASSRSAGSIISSTA